MTSLFPEHNINCEAKGLFFSVNSFDFAPSRIGIYFLIIKPNKLYIPKNINEVGCVYTVTIQGNSMEPALKAGSLLSLNRYIEDKDTISVGKVVLLEENGIKKLGRIKDRMERQDGVFYKVAGMQE